MSPPDVWRVVRLPKVNMTQLPKVTLFDRSIPGMAVLPNISSPSEFKAAHSLIGTLNPEPGLSPV